MNAAVEVSETVVKGDIHWAVCRETAYLTIVMFWETMHMFPRKYLNSSLIRVGNLWASSTGNTGSCPEVGAGSLKKRGAGGRLRHTRWVSDPLRSDAYTLRPLGACFTWKVIWGLCLDLCDMSTILSLMVLWALTTYHHFYLPNAYKIY